MYSQTGFPNIPSTKQRTERRNRDKDMDSLQKGEGKIKENVPLDQSTSIPLEGGERRRLLAEMFSKWENGGWSELLPPKGEETSLSTEQMDLLLQAYEAYLEESIANPLEKLAFGSIENRLTPFFSQTSQTHGNSTHELKELVHKLDKGCDLLSLFHNPDYRSSLWSLISNYLLLLRFQGEDRIMDGLFVKLLNLNLLRQLINQKVNLDKWKVWLNDLPIHPASIEKSLGMHANSLIHMIKEALDKGLILRPPILFLFKLSYLPIIRKCSTSSEKSIEMIIDHLWWVDEEKQFITHLNQLFDLVLPPSAPYSTIFPHLLFILERGLALKKNKFYQAIVKTIFCHFTFMQAEQIEQSREFLETTLSQKALHLDFLESTRYPSEVALQNVYTQMIGHILSSLCFRRDIRHQCFIITKLCAQIANMGERGKEILSETIIPTIPTFFSSSSIAVEECKCLLQQLCQAATQMENCFLREKILCAIHKSLLSNKFQSHHYVEISLALCDLPMVIPYHHLVDSLSHALIRIHSEEGRLQILEKLYEKTCQWHHASAPKAAWGFLSSIFKKCQPHRLEIMRWLNSIPFDSFFHQRLKTIQYLLSLNDNNEEDIQYSIIEPMFSLLKLEAYRQMVREIIKNAANQWIKPFLIMRIAQKLCDALSSQTFSEEDLSIVDCALRKSKKGPQEKEGCLKQHLEELSALFTNLLRILPLSFERKDLENKIIKKLCCMLPQLPFNPSYTSHIDLLLPTSSTFSEKAFEVIAAFAHKIPEEKCKWRYQLVHTLCNHKPPGLPWNKFFKTILFILSQGKETYDTHAIPLYIVQIVFSLCPKKHLASKQKIAEILLSQIKGSAKQNLGCLIVKELHRQLFHLPHTQREPLENFILSQISLLSQSYMQLLPSLVIDSYPSSFPARVVVTMMNSLPMEEKARLQCIVQCGEFIKGRSIKEQDLVLKEMNFLHVSPHLLTFITSWGPALRAPFYRRAISSCPEFFLSLEGASILEKILLQEQQRVDFTLQLEVVRAIQGLLSTGEGESVGGVRALLKDMIRMWDESMVNQIMQRVFDEASPKYVCPNVTSHYEPSIDVSEISMQEWRLASEREQKKMIRDVLSQLIRLGKVHVKINGGHHNVFVEGGVGITLTERSMERERYRRDVMYQLIHVLKRIRKPKCLGKRMRSIRRAENRK